MLSRFSGLFCLLGLVAPLPSGVELHLHFRALDRLLTEQFFTPEGRMYVRGSKAARCNFAFLENPRVGGENGRLRIRARFSGRSALDLFGRCVGLGDSFELSIRATPAYKDGVIGLENVEVSGQERSTFYSRRVSKALAASLARDFRYDVRDQARKILEEKRPGVSWRQEVSDFSVTAIRVSEEAIVLSVAFRLAVK